MANTETKSLKLTSPVTLWSFPTFFEPKSIGDSEPKYGLTMLMDEDENPEHSAFIVDVEKMIKAAATERWGKVPRDLKVPLGRGEDRWEGYEGRTFLRTSSNRQPGLIDARKEPISVADSSRIFGGVYGRATVSFYAWQHPTGGKGVSCSLRNAQLSHSGPPLGGGAGDPQDDFDEIEVPQSYAGTEEDDVLNS